MSLKEAEGLCLVLSVRGDRSKHLSSQRYDASRVGFQCLRCGVCESRYLFGKMYRFAQFGVHYFGVVESSGSTPHREVTIIVQTIGHVTDLIEFWKVECVYESFICKTCVYKSDCWLCCLTSIDVPGAATRPCCTGRVWG